MGLSGLLGASGDRTGRPKSIASTASSTDTLPTTPPPDPAASRPTPPLPEHIADESHLKPLDPERPDLRELNACLDALAAVFPDVQIEVFRDMFSSFDGESRLALVADELLKNRVTWVKGRWRTVAADGQLGDPPVPKKETFRSPEYIHAAKTLASHEFKGLSRSAITAVLAENNYSYLDARQTLVNLSSKSWRFTISSLFLRRKPVSATEAENHPLVIWKSTGRGSIVPTLKSTGNAELDRELFTALIQPLIDRARTDREANDHQLAVDLNNTEAEQADSMLECACCFTESAFEEFTSCNASGHTVCFRCVQHCISEAVFGQAWQRSINRETGTLRCPAVDAAECEGCIPQDHMHRAMLQEKNGAEVMHSLQQRLADHSLVGSELPLIRCPFCAYAEVDDIYLPAGESDLEFRPETVLVTLAILFCAPIVFFSLPPSLILYSLLFLTAASLILYSLLRLTATTPLLNRHLPLRAHLTSEFRAAMLRRRRRRRGLRFNCQNPSCARPSCLSCNKAWTDVHVCHESALVALRTQVEQAMSMAVKRVCPRCNTSFVKTAGCNKLTCPCGYKMCYVCRKDIGGSGGGEGEGYRHFCEHFRPHGDPRRCESCTKCNLWEAEDTEEVVRRAKEEVERKWREAEQRELSGAEVRFLETGVLAQPGVGGVGMVIRRGRWPSLEEGLDCLLEMVLV